MNFQVMSIVQLHGGCDRSFDNVIPNCFANTCPRGLALMAGPLAQEPRPDSRPDRPPPPTSPGAPSRRYLDQYYEGGLPHLRRCRWHHPHSTLAKHQDLLEEYFLKHPVRSAKQARAIIEQQTGVRRGLSQVRHFLKGRLGLRGARPGPIPVPPKKTVEEHGREQATFVQEKLGPRLEQARPGRRQVYFVDAAHFVFAPFLGCLWVQCAAVRAGGLGSQAVQRPGGARRGDTPAASG